MGSVVNGKRLYLRLGDEVNHDGNNHWGIGVVVEVMTSSVPGGTCLARIRFQDGQLRVFDNDMESDRCCCHFGLRRYWNPSPMTFSTKRKLFSP